MLGMHTSFCLRFRVILAVLLHTFSSILSIAWREASAIAALSSPLSTPRVLTKTPGAQLHAGRLQGGPSHLQDVAQALRQLHDRAVQHGVHLPGAHPRRALLLPQGHQRLQALQEGGRHLPKGITR